MRRGIPIATEALPRRDDVALRICLDANIWVAYLDALTNGRDGTAIAQLVDIVTSMASGTIPLQLVLSYELMSTIDRVLLRLGFSEGAVKALGVQLGDLMSAGPEHLEPPILLSGRDQLAMRDREDAGVLAACMAARVGLLVTDNLRDFETNDSERIDTQQVSYRDDRKRQLYAILHTRADGVSLVVMHPFDALEWLRTGARPTPDAVRERYVR